MLLNLAISKLSAEYVITERSHAVRKLWLNPLLQKVKSEITTRSYSLKTINYLDTNLVSYLYHFSYYYSQSVVIRLIASSSVRTTIGLISSFIIKMCRQRCYKSRKQNNNTFPKSPSLLWDQFKVLCHCQHLAGIIALSYRILIPQQDRSCSESVWQKRYFNRFMRETSSKHYIHNQNYI